MGAAEAHGFLSGFQCMFRPLGDAEIEEFMLGDKNIDKALTDDYVATVNSLSEEIREQLDAPEFGFQLLLPDESSSLPDRGNALAEWCQGFLSGLGIAGHDNWEHLSDQGRELLSDIEKIGRLKASVDDIDDENSEIALNELIEYVRMGALYIHDEAGALMTDEARDKPLH